MGEGGDGYWRLDMRLGLVLGYGNAFGAEWGPECWGVPPPPFKPCPAWVGGGYQSGWGRLLSVTNADEAGTWRQGDSGWA